MFLRLKKAFDKTLIAFIHFEMFDVKNNLIIFMGYNEIFLLDRISLNLYKQRDTERQIRLADRQLDLILNKILKY